MLDYLSGQGNFGKVWKGLLEDNSGVPAYMVAVKEVKATESAGGRDAPGLVDAEHDLTNEALRMASPPTLAP